MATETQADIEIKIGSGNDDESRERILGAATRYLASARALINEAGIHRRQLRFGLANALKRQALWRWGRAVAIYRRHPDEEPARSNVFFGGACLSYEMGHLDQCAEWCREALAGDPPERLERLLTALRDKAEEHAREVLETHKRRHVPILLHDNPSLPRQPRV